MALPKLALQAAVVALLTAVWWASAVAVTLLQKEAFKPESCHAQAWCFPYPLTLTFLSNVGTALVSGPLSLLAGPPRSPAPEAPIGRCMQAAQDRPKATLVAMGVLNGLSLGAKNEALLLLSVSARTMLMSASVLVVMLVARLFGLDGLGRAKLCAAALLALGGSLQALAAWRFEGRGAVLGAALAVLSMFLDALRWVLLQASFSGEASQGGGKLRMVAWVMLASAPLCLALSLAFEPEGLPSALRRPEAALGLVGLLALGVLGINVAEFGVVQWTSAVTFNVLAQLHGLPLVLAGLVFFGEAVAPLQGLGFAVCLVGALVYARAKAKERREQQPRSSVLEVPLTPNVGARQGGEAAREA